MSLSHSKVKQSQKNEGGNNYYPQFFTNDKASTFSVIADNNYS